MESTPQTAQPVNAAITEADVLAFFATANKAVKAEFSEASLNLLGNSGDGKNFSIWSYGTNHIMVFGATVSDTVAEYRKEIIKTIPTAAKLRAEAAAKMAEADALEAKLGGAK